MLRKVLEERFKLVLRREQKEMKALLLKVTNNKKPVLTRSEETDKMFSGSRVQIDPGGRTYMKIEGGKATMATLARTLTFAMRRPVLDRTGITGEFNFVIEYDDDGIVRPILPDALRERTGLELQDTKALVETWVIERAERPSEN
jgi:uncharacterized protein (TIGR03435 family)